MWSYHQTNTNQMRKFYVVAALLVVAFFQSCQNDKTDAIEDAVFYFNNNQFDKSLKIIAQVLRDNPDDFFAYTVQGRALFALNQTQQGIEAMNKAIELNPDYFQAFAYRGTMYQSIGEHQKALNDIEKALEKDGSNLDLIRIEANLLYILQQNEKAIKRFDKLIALNNEDEESFVYRAILNKRLGLFEAALSDFKQAISVNPNYDFAYEARADFYTYTLSQNFEQAIEDYTKVIDNFSKNIPNQNKAYVYNNRGFARYQAKDFEGALEDINASLQLFPDNAFAFKNRALVYLAFAKTDSMCADLTKAKALGYEKKYGQEVNQLLSENCSK